MSKFNKTTTRPAVTSPVKTESTPIGTTFEGAPGFLRDTKSELFLLAVSNMVGEQTFYENADTRDNRYAQLVRTVAVEDPDWTARFLAWLRSTANMRSASLVGGLEAAKALKDASLPGGRQIIDSVLKRADEPGEALAYWTSTHGRNVPKPVKRGVADAVQRLYSEYSLLKYDTASKGFRFGDVIDLVHPDATAQWQGELYKHALDRCHGHADEVAETLAMVNANQELRRLAATDARVLLDPDRLKAAGFTWEDALSLAGDRIHKSKLWEALIPSMGYMALLRNLRNFDEAGVSDKVAQEVAGRLSDPEQVKRSRQFPFRFLSAYKAANSLRWSYPLEVALNLSLSNVPALSGRTLVLVDRSPSMWVQQFSKHSTMPWADAAAVFGAAVALRAENADLVEFGHDSAAIPFRKGTSVLKVMDQFTRQNGTDIPSAVVRHLNGHDRIVIVTDEQSQPGWLPSNGFGYGSGMRSTLIDDLVPKSTPLYMWNFGGYSHGATSSGVSNRHTFGGLTDQAFKMVPLLEAGRNADWPF